MNIALRLVACLLLVPTIASATGVEIPSTWYIRLDNRFYQVNPGTFSVGSNLISLGSLTTTLANCRRASGANQSATVNRLSYANGTKVVYLTSSVSVFDIVRANGTAILLLTSATADIICDGEQANPTIPLVLFESGFE